MPGGGVTLINLAATLSEENISKADIVKYVMTGPGRHILKDALEQPFRILLQNSGFNPDEWLPLVVKAKPGWGIDINNPEKLVDLKASGIVDPTRVTKEAIQNAVSIAGTAMTMGALVVDVPEKEKADPAAGMGGMGGMM